MGKAKGKLWQPKCHRAVDWSESAITKALKRGSLHAGIKFDGYRVHILEVCGHPVMTSREGIEFKGLRPLAESIWASNKWLHDTNAVLDGEVHIPGATFEEQGLLRRDRLTNSELLQCRVVLYDIGCVSDYEGWGVSGMGQRGLLARQRKLHKVVHWQCRVEALVPVADMGAIITQYQTARLNGHEGLVLKDVLLPMRNGKVSGMWKVKPGCGATFTPGVEADGQVVAPLWGNYDKANAGLIIGFVVKLEDSREMVHATGLTQDQMRAYTDEHTRYGSLLLDIGSPFNGRHCRVSGMEKTATGSIRHPHFDGFRDLRGTKA